MFSGTPKTASKVLLEGVGTCLPLPVGLAKPSPLITRLLAGGSGSGCHGDNCGRPAGATFDPSQTATPGTTESHDHVAMALENSQPGTFGASPELRQYRSAVKKNFNALLAKTNELTPTQAKAAKNYSTSDYQIINGWLRGTRVPMTSEVDRAQTTITELQAACLANRLPEDMVAFRGAKLDAKILATMTPGAVFKDKGFTSTSVDLGAAQSFGSSVVFRISLPKGTPALPNKYSIKGEVEVILPANSNFRVIGRQAIRNSSGVTTTVIYVNHEGTLNVHASASLTAAGISSAGKAKYHWTNSDFHVVKRDIAKNTIPVGQFDPAMMGIQAGGPGSGCHGGNCGRPKEASYDLPHGMYRSAAKEYPLHETWERAKNWRQQAYGGVVANKKGQFLLREPANHFDGYSWTFPKGKMDSKAEHPVDTALREVKEEAGKHVAIFDQLPGTYKSGSGSHNSFYLMRSYGDDPGAMDKETWKTKWASFDEAKQLISQSKNKDGRERDLAILHVAKAHLDEHYQKKATIEAGGPGSGCHGDNCGRPAGPGHAAVPKDTGKLLEQHGWKKTGYVKEGKVKSIWSHPVEGQLTVHHLPVWKYEHTFQYQGTSATSHGNIAAPGAGKKGIGGLHEYLQHVHGYPEAGKSVSNIPTVPPVGKATPAPAPVASKPASTAPPNNLPLAVKGPKGGTYTWNGYSGKYEHSNKPEFNKTPAQITNALTNSTGWKMKSGNVFVTPSYGQQHMWKGGATSLPTPVSSPRTSPPTGMEKQYVNPAGVKTTWDPNSGKYVSQSGAALAIDVVKTAVEVGHFTPGLTPHEALGNPEKAAAIAAIKPSPLTSTTPIPGKMESLSPASFTLKAEQPSLGGAHQKMVFQDHNGGDWLFKPATTIAGQASPMIAHADEAVSRIAQAIRPGYAVEAKAIDLPVPGKGAVLGSVQKMIPNNVLRGEGGKFKDFTGRNFDTSPYQPWETSHLQREQVLDWLVSNHDSHAGQFLRTSGQYVGSRSVIGIDKSQAFKFLGKDELSTSYHPNTMEKPPIYNDLFSRIQAGKATFDPMESLPTIEKIEGISRSDYKDMLQPYADARFGPGTAAKSDFLAAAVLRKESIRTDFQKFYAGVLGKKFEFEPVYDPSSKAVVNVGTGKKAETLPDNEVRPNNAVAIKAALPELLSKYPTGGHTDVKGHLTSNSLNNWQAAYNKTDPTLAVPERWKAAAKGQGLYPELAAKVGLLPGDMEAVRSAILQWSSSTGTTGASNIRAAAQDVMSGNAELKSRFSAALQIEHEVTKAKLAVLHPSGVIELYRGLGSSVAKELKAAKQTAGLVEYHAMGAEGWTTVQHLGFGDGTKLHVSNMPIANVITAHSTSPEPFTLQHEAEHIVAFPGKVMHLKPSQILGKAGTLVAAIMAELEKYIVDGTAEDQWHTSFPVGKQKKSASPAETITMYIAAPDGAIIVPFAPHSK